MATTLKVKHGNRKYNLDPEAAIRAGAMTEETYKVELSSEEAQTLQFILTHIGGLNSGPRGFASSVAEKLRELGVEKTMRIERDLVNSAKGNIYLQ